MRRPATETECAAAVGGYMIAKGLTDDLFRAFNRYVPQASLIRLGAMCAHFQAREGKIHYATDADLAAEVATFLYARGMPNVVAEKIMEILSPSDLYRLGMFASGKFARVGMIEPPPIGHYRCTNHHQTRKVCRPRKRRHVPIDCNL